VRTRWQAQQGGPSLRAEAERGQGYRSAAAPRGSGRRTPGVRGRARARRSAGPTPGVLGWPCVFASGMPGGGCSVCGFGAGRGGVRPGRGAGGGSGVWPSPGHTTGGFLAFRLLLLFLSSCLGLLPLVPLLDPGDGAHEQCLQRACQAGNGAAIHAQGKLQNSTPVFRKEIFLMCYINWVDTWATF